MDNSICNKDFKIFIEDFPSENLQNIILEATVPTGMENIAALEIIEKLNVVKENIFTLQGRLYFFTKIDDFNIVCICVALKMYLVTKYIYIISGKRITFCG